MKNNRKRFISILLTLLLAVLLVVPTSAVSPLKVELGTTSTFAILAGSAITNTGTTNISGDAGGNVGLYPGTSFGSTGVTMTGTAYVSDGPGVASLAKTDLTTAYNDAAGRTPTATIAADLGGTTLTHGVYNSQTGISITGTLTLDAQGDPEAVFIFQAGSTLTTASGSEVKLINGARYCRVFWQVGSSATLGTSSKFVGHIFANESITATTGARVQGQLLARTGAVTLDSNIIINGICAEAATLYVIKRVINDNSGTAIASDFTLHVKTIGASSGDVFGSPAFGTTIGSSYSLEAGDYVISEDAAIGYTASFSGADANGNVTLEPGDIKTVTITNNDNGGPPTPLIAITKTPLPLELTSGEGLVRYTYRVTNPGIVELNNVSVTDNKISIVNFVSGDINSDHLLQPGETWIYTAETMLWYTTTNMATARGISNGIIATNTAFATVVVSFISSSATSSAIPSSIVTSSAVTSVPGTSSSAPVILSATDEQIPDMGSTTQWGNILLFATVFLMIGSIIWILNKRYE